MKINLILVYLKSLHFVIVVDGHVFEMTLLDGRKITLVKKVIEKPKEEDKVNDYGCILLELGLMFKNMLNLTKMPDRQRGIRLLKLLVIYFKSNNNLSKYAYECIRLLVHQLCSLSDKKRHEEFYGLFVNTTGQFDGHIPADLRMEYMVKEVKKHIKHMFSNKTERNIENRTRAIAGIPDIAESFDKQSNVIVRAKKHSHLSSMADELTILQDLRKLRPFRIHPGRTHSAFPNVKRSVVDGLDVNHFHNWVRAKKFEFALEKGN